MARAQGSTSTVTIPLSTLTEKLNGLGSGVKVKVGKGWLKAMGEAHDIDFGIAEDESVPAEKAATAPEARPSAQVD